jgi:hypothetical protein
MSSGEKASKQRWTTRKGKDETTSPHLMAFIVICSTSSTTPICFDSINATIQ